MTKGKVLVLVSSGHGGCPTFRLLVRGSWGALIRLLISPQKQKGPESWVPALKLLQMVAGVRFELTTFGL